MAMIDTQTTDELSLRAETVGYPHVPASTLLTRLNYFDGKFLRADDLRTEQEYHRRHVELSNRGGGSGVVEGFDVTKGSGDQLAIGAGLAIDGAGRVLYLPDGFSASLAEIVAKTSRAAELMSAAKGGSSEFARCIDGDGKNGKGGAVSGAEFYKLSIAHAEDACGNEDVYGKLCEDACATDEQRRYLVEGIVLRATPFRPQSPFPTSKVVALTERHVRSQLASAWFADEAATHGRQMSAEWLRSGVWCRGARREPGNEVPIAIVIRTGNGLVVDEWIVRRERIEPPPRRYWAWNMAMRPWEVFLAQVLQFQCQLDSAGATGGGFDDPCKPHADALAEAERYIEEIDISRLKYERTRVSESRASEATLIAEAGVPFAAGLAALKEKFRRLRDSVWTGSSQVLIDGGIVELPSSGYLTVLPGSNPSVEDQVRRLLGAGVDLRFCAVRADYVPHALEEAQHMERISLLSGLDRPDSKPKVDILVPDATVLETKAPAAELMFDTELLFAPRIPIPQIQVAERMLGVVGGAIDIHGAGRAKKLDSGGSAFYVAGATELHPSVDATKLLTAFIDLGGADDTHLRVIDEASTPEGGFVEAAPAGEPALLTAERTGSTDELIADRSAAMRDRISTLFSRDVVSGPTRTGAAPLAFWADLECADNPFAPDVKTTRISLVADVVAHARETTLVHVDIHGKLVIKNRAAIAGVGSVVVGQFSGSSIVEVDGSSKPGKPNFQVKFTLLPVGKKPRLLIELSVAENYMLELAADWNVGHPLKITALAGIKGSRVARAANLEERVSEITIGPGVGAGAALPLAGAIAKEDPKIADETNDLHRIALKALDVIEAATEQSDFAETTAANLFPPSTAPTERSLVATRDWVLFQRRRETDCLGQEAPRPEPVPVNTTRYRVFEYRDTNPKNTKRVMSLLTKGTPSDNDVAELKRALQPVGDVEFLSGTDTLASPPSQVVEAWTAVDPGPLISFALIATDETGDSEATLEARVHAYEDAVVAVSRTDSNTQLKTRDDLAALRDDAAGVIVVITEGAATVTHCVYAVSSESDELGIQQGIIALKSVMAFGDFETFKSATDVFDLGTITFEPGTDSPIEPVLLAKLAASGAPRFAQEATVVQQEGKHVQSDDEIRPQVKKLAGLADAGAIPPDSEITSLDLPFALPCPIVTFLVVNKG